MPKYALVVLTFEGGCCGERSENNQRLASMFCILGPPQNISNFPQTGTLHFTWSEVSRKMLCQRGLWGI